MATHGKIDPALANTAVTHSSALVAFLGECWQRLAAMYDAFERPQMSDGTESKRHSQDRLRDDRAWARSL